MMGATSQPVRERREDYLRSWMKNWRASIAEFFIRESDGWIEVKTCKGERSY